MDYTQPDLFKGREMHPNSIITYKEKVLPSIAGRKLQVLNAIKALGGEASSYEVALYLNRPIHTLSGRFTELFHSKYEIMAIEDTGRVKRHGESNFTIWKAL
jgi:hypothetical protein